jgi:hypothetical protein
VNSLTYSLVDDGYGTYSVITDPTSVAILFEYYVNNGIPYGSSPDNNNYTADGRYSDTEPYFITQTFSTPFVSATRSGTEVQFEISKDSGFTYIYYFGDNSNSIIADVPLVEENSKPYLTYPVVGILESLEGGTASISQVPEIIELSPTTGIYDGTQEEFTDLIVAFNPSDELSVFANYWYVSGGDDLISFFYYFDGNIGFFMSINSPVYRAITSGVVGDNITFVRTIPIAI